MLEIYREKVGEGGLGDWKWRLLDAKGAVLAQGMASFKKRSACRTAVDRLIRDLPTARIVEILN